MPETHDYPTKTIIAKNLTKSNVLVGASGGLSAVYEVRGSVYGKVVVVTEHGSMSFDPGDTLAVYHEKRTASQIRNDLDNHVSEEAWGLIDELAEDLLDSVRLALDALVKENPLYENFADGVITTVRDYYGNNYSD